MRYSSWTAATVFALILTTSGAALGAAKWLSCPVGNTAFRLIVFDEAASTFHRYLNGALYPCNVTISGQSIAASCGDMNVSIDRQTGRMALWSNSAAAQNRDDAQFANCQEVAPLPLTQRKF
jgi:hypothetical protein